MTATRSAQLKALTRPDTVAIIGASDSPGKLQSRPMRFMRRHGYRGRIFPVNPARPTVLGEPAFASLGAIGERIEHAYVLLDTEAAVQAFDQCADAGVSVVTLVADGFAEAGPAGAALQRRLVARAREAGVLLIGPNSTGVIDTRSGFSCTTNAAFATDTLAAGRFAVISQSGSLIGTLYSRGAARGLAFSTLVSVGNEAAAGVGEIGDLLLDDAGTDGFVLFMETVRNPQAIAAFARRAHSMGKPVVCYMIGRSAEGQALSVSHTGAMTGSAQAVSSFLRAQGVREVDNFETLLEAPAALLKSGSATGRPRTVTVVSTTGGGGAMVIDRLGERGVAIAGCSSAARSQLEAQRIPLGHGKLVDVTLAGTRYESMKAVVSTLIDDPHTGVLLVAIGSSAQFNPELAVKPLIDALAEAPAGAAPALAFPLPQADESLRMLATAGVPAFRTVESCAETVAMLMNDASPEPLTDACDPAYAAPLTGFALRLAATRAGKQAGARVETPSEGGRREPGAPADGRQRAAVGLLNEVEAGELIGALGIARPEQRVLAPDEPPPADIGFAYPVVAKLVSAQLPHKSEMGAICVGIAEREALVAAIARMKADVALNAPQAVIDAVLVQSMQTGVAEMLVGFTRDPLVGPVVTVGMGGIATEIYRDVAVRPAPVAPQVARAMLDEVRGAALLRGFRGRPAGDVDALAEAIAAFSRLAAIDEVAEAEINPLLVRVQGAGVVMLDALIRLADA